MKYIHPINLLILFLIIPASSKEEFTNDFAVKIDGDNSNVAALVAATHGCQIVRHLNLFNVYHFRHPKIKRRSKRSAENFLNVLKRDPNVMEVEQQRILEIVKKNIFNDPKWPLEWYVFNNDNDPGPYRMDMNLLPAWFANIKGDGIVISIIDDGVDYTHPDLVDSYLPDISYDFNGDDNDPFPNDSREDNGHGTKVAGTISAKPNNNICGVGLAHNAKFSAIRALDGPITDILQAAALSHNLQTADIISASWGPPDTGDFMVEPPFYSATAIRNGAEQGRNGSGNIFVWAAGNGNHEGDFCSFDGYVNSMYTIGIGSVTNTGSRSYYSESCTAIMATTFTGSSHTILHNLEEYKALPNNIVTSSLHHECNERFVGTSASTPQASSCIALTLQANPKLTWRDVQHIIAKTARISSIMNDDDWIVNSGGYHFSPKYGFGTLDCSSMVAEAQRWVNVNQQKSCVIKGDNDVTITANEPKILTLSTNICDNEAKIDTLEHVFVYVNLTVNKRGAVQLKLTSPSNIISLIMPKRHKDAYNGTFSFEFLTLLNWGENSHGNWTLEILSESDDILNDWELRLYGTTREKTAENHHILSDSDENEKFKDNQEELLNIIRKEDIRSGQLLPSTIYQTSDSNKILKEIVKLADTLNMKDLNKYLLEYTENIKGYAQQISTNWAKILQKSLYTSFQSKKKSKIEQLFQLLKSFKKKGTD